MLNLLKYTSLAVLCSASTLVAQNTEQEFRFRAIQVEPTDNAGLFTAAVKVEETNARFLIDTGCAYMMAYDTDFLKGMGKALTETGKAIGVGGAGTTYSTTVDFASVGGVVELGKQENAKVLPVKHLDHLKTGGQDAMVSGLIGSSLLKQIRGVFDYGTPRIIVPPSDAPKGVYQLSMKQQGATILPLMEGPYNFPYVTMNIEGADYAFLIDTGANAHVISPLLVEKLKLEVEDQDIAVRGMQKAQGVKVVRLKDPVLAKHFKLTELKLHIIDAQKTLKMENGMEIGGIIGTSLLKQLKAQLDFDTYSLIVPKR